MTSFSTYRAPIIVAMITLAFGFAPRVEAQTLTTLANFRVATGSNPPANFVQGFDGNFYSVTINNGTNFGGTAFRINPAGQLKIIYSFCGGGDCTGGGGPQGSMIQALDGNFYGTLLGGGANSVGTVYKLTPQGVLTTLHDFDVSDGSFPYAGLLEASDGNFYGTTLQGGASGFGTVFKITRAGVLTTLHSFAGVAEGCYPEGTLVEVSRGVFYGTTANCGAFSDGTIYKITAAGSLSTLHSSEGSDIGQPYDGLTLGNDGNLYGTTVNGGAFAKGTVFKMTPAGSVTTLHSFDGSDGYQPWGSVVQANDGNLYGMTSQGGTGICNFNSLSGCGTIFEIAAEGTFSTVHDFVNTDGSFPNAGLIQGTDGNFYGTTWYGGTTGNGTAFSFSTGLPASVATVPVIGKTGATVVILGNSLTGTTSVSFNGTPATFTVVSPTQIRTTVPAGATSGTVQVVTPTSTLTSNPIFRVVN
jgi:uncharacterized repeat protein (TIGR03803 family)